MFARSIFLAVSSIIAFFVDVGMTHADPSKVKAVVVGVATYPKLGDAYKLPRSASDADGFAVLLNKLGVPSNNITTLKGSPTLDELRKAWATHLQNIKSGDVSIFFFSGHGHEQDKEPYLLLADFDRPNSKGSIPLLSLATALKSKGNSVTGIFIVDACRTDAGEAAAVPAPGRGAPVGGTGLESSDSFPPVRAPEGTFIFYAASTKQIALHDLGPGDSSEFSVYTRGLLVALAQQTGKGLHEIAKDVRWQTYQLALKRKKPDGTPQRHIQVPAYFDDMLVSRTILGDPILSPELAIPNSSKPGPVIASLGKGIEWACSSCPELVQVDPPDGPVAVRGGVVLASDGKPLETSIAKRYAIGKYEITRDEWRACQIAGKCPVLDPMIIEGDRRPIAGVSWDDAQKYISWLNSIEGLGGGFRLPSEGEWEHAARGGSASEYGPARGVAQLCDYANGADASLKSLMWANLTCNDGKGRGVTPAGSYRPNGYEIHDMLGNVWELVSDCFDSACAMRTAKGGSWRSGPDAMKVTSARALQPDDRRRTVGFRIARDLD